MTAVARVGHAPAIDTRENAPAWWSPIGLTERQPHLAAAALLSLMALIPCLFAMAIDARTINDVSVWMKPAKFLVSFAVYYATLAWVFGFLPRAAQTRTVGRFVIYGALITGALEMIWLLLAAAHGVPAHFNFTSPAWGLAYSAAGAGSIVLIGAILVQGLMIAGVQGRDIQPAMRWSLVAGAVIAFAATLIVAGYLSMQGGHWVGGNASDAGGLPVLGWSRTGGDLRVAHFWALHAQQALPLVGLILVAAGRPRARAAVLVAALAYLALIGGTFVQALYGRAFMPWL